MSFSTTRLLCAALIGGALSCTNPLAASAASDVLACQMTDQVVAQVTAQASTTSKTFVNLPGAEITVTPAQTDCIVVQFSAQVRANAPQTMRVRVKINDAGATVFPAFVDLYTSENKFDNKAANFVIFGLSSEMQKVIRIQYESVDGGAVFVNKGVMMLQYRPAT